jgi:hypothetical protein
MSTAPPRPAEVRQIETPAALALADLAGIFEDLQTVLRCCERLMAALASPGPGGPPDDLAVEAYWKEAVLAYGRCFATGARGQQLTPDDLAGVGLPGDVPGWHRTLTQLQQRYQDVSTSASETFSVGVARDDTGRATGVALTSARAPMVDEVTVRQTGAVAFELSRIVDDRMGELQRTLFAHVLELSGDELDRLPLLDVAEES